LDSILLKFLLTRVPTTLVYNLVDYRGREISLPSVLTVPRSFQGYGPQSLYREPHHQDTSPALSFHRSSLTLKLTESIGFHSTRGPISFPYGSSMTSSAPSVLASSLWWRITFPNHFTPEGSIWAKPLLSRNICLSSGTIPSIARGPSSRPGSDEDESYVRGRKEVWLWGPSRKFPSSRLGYIDPHMVTILGVLHRSRKSETRHHSNTFHDLVSKSHPLLLSDPSDPVDHLSRDRIGSAVVLLALASVLQSRRGFQCLPSDRFPRQPAYH